VQRGSPHPRPGCPPNRAPASRKANPPLSLSTLLQYRRSFPSVISGLPVPFPFDLTLPVIGGRATPRPGGATRARAHDRARSGAKTPSVTHHAEGCNSRRQFPRERTHGTYRRTCPFVRTSGISPSAQRALVSKTIRSLIGLPPSSPKPQLSARRCYVRDVPRAGAHRAFIKPPQSTLSPRRRHRARTTGFAL
jgi:hypothetical protein